MILKKVFSNNQEWIQKKLNVDSTYFENLAKGQNPEILYIGCSDSRVTAEDMMGLAPGEAFIHRNIANVVSNLDISAMSVLNYAVEHLKVKHIVVCGHYYCGGVKAAMTASDLGILNPWLKNIRDVYRLHQNVLEAIDDDEARYKKLVELNVQEQCINTLKNKDVQDAYHQGRLEVHGWVFDISTGAIIDLQIDIKAVVKDIMSIYNLS